jgi:hypothetical protein
MADDHHCRPFGDAVGIACRDSLSLASLGEHNSLAADGVDVDIGYSAACAKAVFIAAIWVVKAPGFE